MLRSAVVGAGGYSGAELVGLLLAHPDVELAGLYGASSRHETRDFAALHPRWRGATLPAIEPVSVDGIVGLAPDVVFLATPHAASHDLAPALLDAHDDVVIADLSGAFRLPDAGAYDAHYGFAHRHPDLLAEAVYGLPERHRAAIAAARLVAVPGCYPTASVLALAPLAAAGAIEPGRPVIIDATSGVSGAGRAATDRTHFCAVSLQPYGVLGHRHQPEIDHHAGAATIFTPHLGAYDRGILATIHVPLADGWGDHRVRAALDDAYGPEPFVQLLPPGAWPGVADVRGTNRCDIACAVDPARRHAVVVSAIDNLVKGAAGQAVQCLNVRFGLPETAGLQPETITWTPC